MTRANTNWPNFILSADGTSIAWESHGDGFPVVFTNGLATSHSYWALLRADLHDYRTILWDLKGHGRSGPAKNLDRCSIPDAADDLRRVMDAAGIDRAVLAGFSLGCQIILEAWRLMPDRIAGLVPALGTYGRPFDTLLHPTVGRAAFRAFQAAAPFAQHTMEFAYHSMRTPWAHAVNQATGMVGRDLDRRLMEPFYAHFADVDGASWAQMGIFAQQHTTWDVLPTISVPTLIIAGGKDALTPAHLSREMHDRIPGSKLLFLPKATHAGLLEYPVEINREVRTFLRRLT
ncbi:MAG: alpha/beta hydrolase [bacterium]